MALFCFSSTSIKKFYTDDHSPDNEATWMRNCLQVIQVERFTVGDLPPDTWRVGPPGLLQPFQGIFCHLQVDRNPLFPWDHIVLLLLLTIIFYSRKQFLIDLNSTKKLLWSWFLVLGSSFIFINSLRLWLLYLQMIPRVKRHSNHPEVPYIQDFHLLHLASPVFRYVCLNLAGWGMPLTSYLESCSSVMF